MSNSGEIGTLMVQNRGIQAAEAPRRRALKGELPAANRTPTDEQDLYVKIFESLPNPVILVNADHQLSHLNQAAAELLSALRDPEEIHAGGDCSYPLETIDFLADDLNSFLVSQERQWIFEKTISTPNGPGHFQIKFQRLLDVSQTSPGTIVILNDLTGCQNAAEALRVSGEQYRMLFNSSNDAVFVHPPVTGEKAEAFIEFNDKACQSLGYTREELAQLSPLDLGNADILSKFIAIRKELMAEKQVLFETEHVAKDGSRIPVEINARLINYYGRPLVLSIVRNISRRKQAESEIQRLASFPQLNPNPIIEADASGTITYANPATLTAGIRNPQVLLPPDLGKLMQAAHEQRERHCYHEVKINDVLYAIDVTFPEHLQVARLYATDITDRRQMEEQVELKGRLLDSATDIISLCEMDGTLVYCNESMCTHLGYCRDELMNRKIPSLLTPEHARQFKARVKNLQAHGEAVFETAYLRKDGAVIPVEDQARLLTVHGRTAILSVSRNISERKAAAMALMEAAHKWRTTFDAIKDGVFLMDRDGRIIQANRALAKLVGKPFNEIIGHSCWEVLYKATDYIADCPLLRMRQSRRRETLVLPRGRRWLKQAVDPIINSDKDIIGTVHIITDITESVRADINLRNSLEKLQRTLCGTVSALASTVETRDPYTSGHQRRVALLAAAIAREMGFSADKIEGMRVIGFLHDIGKIAIPAEILSKPGKITPLEFELIKDHPRVGYEILKSIEFPWPVAQVVYQHHERLDGSGYPLGILDKDIILEARILMVADVVEAMASHRPYRPALGIDQALGEITRNKGRLYDSAVVDACFKVFTEKGFRFS